MRVVPTLCFGQYRHRGTDIASEDYASLANVIWSVANMSDSLHGVRQDSKADPDYLNDWYDDDGRSARWT